MLLAIDCGNTNTVFALYEAGKRRGAWRTSTNERRTADEYAVWLNQLMALDALQRADIDSVIIATVVPETSFNLRTLSRRYFGIDPLIVGAPGVDLGIEIRVDRPGEVGADRLVNAVAAHASYGGELIVIDFGTATTFDVVEADGAYGGGVIAPGINLSLDALYRAAAQLPRIAIQPPGQGEGGGTAAVIGKTTHAAMQSGIYWGYVGLIEGIVARIRAERGAAMTVIATGGLAPLFARATEAIEQVDPDITLRGLVLIHRRNRP